MLEYLILFQHKWKSSLKRDQVQIIRPCTQAKKTTTKLWKRLEILEYQKMSAASPEEMLYFLSLCIDLLTEVVVLLSWMDTKYFLFLTSREHSKVVQARFLFCFCGVESSLPGYSVLLFVSVCTSSTCHESNWPAFFWSV